LKYQKTMKKSFLFYVLLAALSFNANAFDVPGASNSNSSSSNPKCNLIHLLGSNISVINTSVNNYTLCLTLTRDTTELAFTATDVVDVFFYDTLSFQYLYSNTVTVYMDTSLRTALSSQIPYGTDAAVYTTPLNLTAGKYQFVYSLCCRNPNIVNGGGGNIVTASSVFHTELEVFDNNNRNSSPSCLLIPPTFVSINEPAVFNTLPYDPDADSITWHLTTPLSDYSSAAPVTFTALPGFSSPPCDNGGTFSMNPMSGEMSWTPSAIGLYIQSFEIDEYRNGVQIGSDIKDMQFFVVGNSTSGVLSISPVNQPSYSTAQSCNYLIYTPGQTINFQVNGSSSDTSAAVGLNAYGTIFNASNPAPATFNVTGTGNNLSGTLSWTPPISFSQDIIVVFRVKDGTFTKDYTLLLRRNPPPSNTSVANTQENAGQITVYPNPFHNSVHISLNVTEPMKSDISMINVLGQKVAGIYSGNLQTGTYNFDKDVSLPAGIYYIVVKNNGRVVDTRCVVAE